MREIESAGGSEREIEIEIGIESGKIHYSVMNRRR